VPHPVGLDFLCIPYFLVLIQESRQRKSRTESCMAGRVRWKQNPMLLPARPSAPSPDFQAYPHSKLLCTTISIRPNAKNRKKHYL